MDGGVALATSVRDRVRVDADPTPERQAAGAWKDQIGRLPVGLVGALGLILVLEAIIARMPVGIVHNSRLSSSWRAALQAAEGPEAKSEILCFGDSLIKLGVVPRVLEARLG